MGLECLEWGFLMLWPPPNVDCGLWSNAVVGNGGDLGYAIGYATRVDSEGLGKLPASCQGVALRKKH